MTSRDLNAELIADLEGLRSGAGLRRTQFLPHADGVLLRRVTAADGSLESETNLTGPRWQLLAARDALGLSQTGFAELLGVSKRTLENWEQGRSQPSGAARTLLKVALKAPEVIRDALAG